MVKLSDITLDSNNDLFIKDGDFAFSYSDQQSSDLIVETYVGNWKQYPLVGVGIQMYEASSGQEQALKQLIQSQLTTDGFVVDLINIVGGLATQQYQYD